MRTDAGLAALDIRMVTLFQGCQDSAFKFFSTDACTIQGCLHWKCHLTGRLFERFIRRLVLELQDLKIAGQPLVDGDRLFFKRSQGKDSSVHYQRAVPREQFIPRLKLSFVPTNFCQGFKKGIPLRQCFGVGGKMT